MDTSATTSSALTFVSVSGKNILAFDCGDKKASIACMVCVDSHITTRFFRRMKREMGLRRFTIFVTFEKVGSVVRVSIMSASREACTSNWMAGTRVVGTSLR